MNYKDEFYRLLETARQVVDCVDFENRSTPFAPLRALKNAVDYYDKPQENSVFSCSCKIPMYHNGRCIHCGELE